MEALPIRPAAGRPFMESHDTALCLIPPNHLWSPINLLRSLNDKAYERWPPHINLIYPFVRPDVLSEITGAICQLDLALHGEIPINLEHAGAFSHKKHYTIHLKPDSDEGAKRLSDLQSSIRSLLGWSEDETYQLHLTVAQSEDSLSVWHNFLLEKARLLTPLRWRAGQLAILVRDPVLPDSDTPASRHMRLWGYIDLSSHVVIRDSKAGDLPLSSVPRNPRDFGIYPRNTYNYVLASHSWHCLSETPNDATTLTTMESLSHLIIASYNVLAEFEWPPSSHRYPALVASILSDRAVADILVLQEVTDQFLSFLLTNREVCAQYPFSTHGPPAQTGVGPLPSLLNIVILSKYPFKWKFLSSSKKNKGFAIATFPTIWTRRYEKSEPLPLVLAACHLRPGLTDVATTAKKHEVQRLINYLSDSFPHHPWVVAGDFNLSTSSHTIETARKRKEISLQSVQCLTDINNIITESGLHDAWILTRLSSGESSNTLKGQESAVNLYEGEQGATFDPVSNSLASKVIENGHDNRPQRYDRILVSDRLDLRPSGFNLFGQPMTVTGGDGKLEYASDHWGIRCLLMVPRQASSAMHLEQALPIRSYKAPPSLASFESLKDCLLSCDCFPTQVGESSRRSALSLLEKTLLGADHVDSESGKRARLSLAFIPVGSYGLGVWTSVSDVDCLCVGSISPKTFFSLALQRLRNAAQEGITILRRVRASSGTMLELQIHGIKFDLQYCAAVSIAERFPEVLNRPPSDQAFALPLSTLSKLKPARDLYYLRRSIPDMSTYRVAHLLIKAWAKNRGLYSAKFGFLGGIHISVMLVPICKMLAREGRMISAADILISFFHHYSGFDWKTQVVFDPFFHHDLKYHRTFREPLCLLGWHPPSLNTALNASIPTVRIIAAELKRASALISQEGMSWMKFLGLDDPKTASLADSSAAEFLYSFKTYLKIDARYWGLSPSKGRKFLGWLESRCISILVDLDRKLPNLLARIWPARFIEEGATADPDNEILEHHGCYLIGLETSTEETSDARDTVIITNGETLYSILRDFESRIRADEKYYDSKCCWMGASVTHARDIGSLQLDRGYWWDHDPADSDSDEDLENEYEDDNDEPSGFSANQKMKVVKSKEGIAQIANKPPTTGKFRSAMDVMNRLRWDTNMNSSDYLVGYEDRFLGAREKALEQWKNEQTDEDFIPQHRILYFKRKSDGSIMWERKTRTDRIFSSQQC